MTRRILKSKLNNKKEMEIQKKQAIEAKHGNFDPLSFRMAVRRSVQYNRWLGKNMLVLIYKRTQNWLYRPKDGSLKAYCEAYNSRHEKSRGV